MPDGDNWAENVSNHKVVVTGDTKEEVVRQVKAKARKEEPAQVVVHRADVGYFSMRVPTDRILWSIKIDRDEVNYRILWLRSILYS